MAGGVPVEDLGSAWALALEVDCPWPQCRELRGAKCRVRGRVGSYEAREPHGARLRAAMRRRVQAERVARERALRASQLAPMAVGEGGVVA